MKRVLKTVDLFAGCGGLSLGFQSAGFRLVGAIDNWEPAVKVYKANFTNHEIYNLDLLDVDDSVEFISKLKPEVIIGGPPCQDFSHAGKRDENGGRANLTVSFADIISNVRPRWFVMENVDQILKSTTLSIAREIFKKAGYGLTEKVLDASLCGVPQKRKRFFMIGELRGKDGALDYYLTKNLSKKPMVVREYLGTILELENYYRHPRNYNRRAIFSIDEPSPTVRGVNRPIPKGYKMHPGDSIQDLTKIRPLTTAERSYIQTFPKEFKFEGSKTDLEQLIGNAVPVNLAKYIAGCILEYIDSGHKFYDPAVQRLQQFNLAASSTKNI